MCCSINTVRVSVVVGVLLLAASATAQVPTTAWGKPDLQGVWDFRSLTPMQRPTDLANQETFTEEEAATFSEEFLLRESRDLADAEAEARETGRVVPYNDFWFDLGQQP